MERLALADRQAHAAALIGRVDEFEWLDVQEYLQRWETWLASDPADSAEAQSEARMRELLEEVA